MSRAIIEPATDDPARGRLVEVRLHRAEHAGDSVIFAGAEKMKQPASDRKLVVVDEDGKFTGGAGERGVAGERDISLRFDGVDDGKTGVARAGLDDVPRGICGIVIDDDDGKRECARAVLARDVSEQPL